ncbi:MAG: hypothetical protein WAM66_10005 [Acidobacteriaceae bacterium]
MVSRCAFSRTSLIHLAIAASTAVLLALPCVAQTQFSPDSDSSQQSSSSSEWKTALASYDLSAAPSASASAQYGQYGRRNNYPNSTNRWSHLAFEVGGGATAPVGNAARDWETWGYNVNVGAGWNFSKYLGTLIEYQFNRMKIPGSTLTALAIANDTGTPIGGNINTWSLTLDPILYLPVVTHSAGAYVTGGGGFYRKVTNFTEPVLSTQCDPYYGFCYSGYVPTTVAHSSSNQGGLNLGLGLYWKAFGPDSNAKLYAEARYVWVDSPKASASDIYGSGTEGFIPITFGLRF